MKKIILHWTAGSYVPTCYEKECYHFLVGNLGQIYIGHFRPEANLVCRSGMYAAHCGGGNTGAVGVALCAMLGFKDKNSVGKFPITQKQFEAAAELVAKLCLKYNIAVSPETVMTHYEFGLKHPETSSRGKIDIVHLPPYSWVAKGDVGGFLRSKVKWYLGRLASDK